MCEGRGVCGGGGVWREVCGERCVEGGVCQCSVWVKVCVMWCVCVAENVEEGVLM